MKRLILSLLIVVLLATIGFGWTLDRLFSQVNSEAGDILGSFRNHGHQLATLMNSEKPEEYLAILNRNSGAELSILDPEELPLPDDLQQELVSGSALALESESGVTLYYFLSKSEKILSYLPPALKDLQRQNRQRMYFTILFYTGLISLTLLWLYPLVKRLLNLSRVARTFGEGDLSTRVQTSRHSFISDIESEFNRMAHRIESLISDNKLLTSAVSHDLRTPIARLRFGIDAVMETEDQSMRNRYLGRISDDLTSMEELVEIMLDYARMEQQLDQVDLQVLNLPDAITKSLNLNNAKNRNVIWNRPAETMLVKANEHYLGMLLNNLISNATKYADANIRIDLVTIYRKNMPDKLQLTIEDDGPGIPVSQRKRLLRPFERNNTKPDGYGMGLAVVSRIAESLHAPMIISDSETLGGACFGISFIKATPAQNAIPGQHLSGQHLSK